MLSFPDEIKKKKKQIHLYRMINRIAGTQLRIESGGPSLHAHILQSQIYRVRAGSFDLSINRCVWLYFLLLSTSLTQNQNPNGSIKKVTSKSGSTNVLIQVQCMWCCGSLAYLLPGILAVGHFLVINVLAHEMDVSKWLFIYLLIRWLGSSLMGIWVS